MLNILKLIDDARCFETVRAMRWPQGVTCPHCDSPQVTKQGHDESQPERQKYECTVCRKRFDDRAYAPLFPAFLRVFYGNYVVII